MRKIILLEFITLDGVMQAPGGPQEDTSGDFQYGGWTFPYFDEEAGSLMGEQMKAPFDLLLGRKTYEIFAGYWPQRGEEWPGVNEATKYVVSHSQIPTPWENSVLITDHVVEALQKIKTEDGPDIQVFGSGNLIQTLLQEDLVDEMWLKIFPITLGQGKKLFGDDANAKAFTLEKSVTTKSGVIFANYKRAGKVETGSF